MRRALCSSMKSLAVLTFLAGCHGAIADANADPVTATQVATPAPLQAPETERTSERGKPGPAEGADFIGDARLLYRIAACGDGPLPDLAHGDDQATAKLQRIVDQHCKAVLAQIAKFRTTYFEKGRAWFDAVVPRSVPPVVVYPFGGGDLISALVAFPEATEITTISLELAGDPRRLATLTSGKVEQSLGGLRAEIGGLISVGSNTSENLSNGQRNELPTQVSSFLLGLVAGGYEPVSMRYFTLDDSGNIHYLDQAEIDTIDKEAAAHRPKSLKKDWQSPNFSHAFANVEIQYRKVGESGLRVHRHIGWNLGDKYLNENPQVLRHLEQKGSVTMLTKGASYLLWRGDFSLMRAYMLEHLAWMLSDSTGIPPRLAKKAKANMVQTTYGTYTGAFLEGAQDNKNDESFIDLWASQKHRRLDFRFGYVDKDKQAHLVVTRPR